MTASRLDREVLDLLTARLLEARAGRISIAPLTTEHPQLSIEDAYAIQRATLAVDMSTGALVAGAKIGLTSKAMQEQLGVGEPDFGVLLDSMMRPDGSRIDVSELISPRVEAEIAVRLERELRGPDLTFDEVADAIGESFAALEIIDSRIADWKIALADTVADNASSALAIVNWRATGLHARELAAETATLYCDDEPVATGTGAALLGDPIEAVRWLANRLASFGQFLPAGHFVLAGAVHASVPLAAGHVYRAFYGSQSQVSFFAD